MNLTQFRHFVAVAEERHFSRAAEKLGIAQPPLSQSIARLEAALGFKLLERTRRSVALTPAGEGLLRELEPALRHLDNGLRISRLIHEGKLQSVTVGYVAAALTKALPAMIREIRELEPECRIRLQLMSTLPQEQALAEGVIDIGIIFPRLDGPPGIDSCTIEESRPVLAIPNDWPLAQKAAVTLLDIQDQPIFMFERERRPELHAALWAEFARQGLKPRVELEPPDTYTTLSLVAAGIGLAIIPAPSSGIEFAGVTFTPLQGLGEHLTLRLAMAWRAHSAPSLADLTARLAEKFAV